ncbi:TPA: hypothetical protein KKX05_002727 [Legionella pneumophila]|nr:hypothetical protein [Legionella pneumophila]HAT7956374.1 hypothetical protein [Legionella pneumophila]HAU1384752.1 hypothetical protein [Legionella pneumophila]HAU2065905.1 hypothetical protein [Legionella pneumophila]HBD7206040.1 hypothetical protein [Legionella pneumophila]|tara:strand:- start:322 stop:528 length:207 start_codon:yes stop_codon:yes gene_type:complete
MGLALAIVIGFLGVVGVTHQEALAHKRIEKARSQQEQLKKQSAKRHKAVRPSSVIARLDGLEIRNLKG